MDGHPQLALPTTVVKFTPEQKGRLLTRILAEKNPFSILALPTREPTAELIRDHYKMLSGLFKGTFHFHLPLLFHSTSKSFLLGPNSTSDFTSFI
jgi:hypothetical protein